MDSFIQQQKSHTFPLQLKSSIKIEKEDTFIPHASSFLVVGESDAQVYRILLLLLLGIWE